MAGTPTPTPATLRVIASSDVGEPLPLDLLRKGKSPDDKGVVLTSVTPGRLGDDLFN